MVGLEIFNMNTILLVVLILLVVVLIVLQLRKSASTSADMSTSLQNLTQTIQDVRVKTATLTMQFETKSVVDKQTAESIKRLETIMAGSSSKGAAGENIIQDILLNIPAEWQVRNFRIGNKPVEFGLRLPDNLILPIDSKWTASELLVDYHDSTDPIEQKKLKKKIEGVILRKAKEVQKYVDPTITYPIGIAVIPDAAYNVCPEVNIETYQQSVMVISYSMLLPYVLMIYQMALAHSKTIDVRRLSTRLQVLERTTKDIQSEIEGRFSKALTMLDISRRHLRTHHSKINTELNSIAKMQTHQSTLLDGKSSR